MEIQTKLAALDHIYSVYETHAQPEGLACGRGCARCCTRNVTLTTLEAYELVKGLIASGRHSLLDTLQQAADKPRFQPKITMNGLAEIYSRDEEPPEEMIDPGWTPCPFLSENECPLYELRPFGCRCMSSTVDCNESGVADMLPFLVTANNIFMQYIEHIDVDGYSGNMIDVLLFMAVDENRRAYLRNKFTETPENLIPNRPLTVLMAPPEERQQLMPILQALQNFKGGS